MTIILSPLVLMLAISQNAQISARACNGTYGAEQREGMLRTRIFGAGRRRRVTTRRNRGNWRRAAAVARYVRTATGRVTLYCLGALGDNLANYR